MASDDIETRIRVAVEQLADAAPLANPERPRPRASGRAGQW